MPTYALFLHAAPDTFADASPAEMQAVVQRYAAWRMKMTKAGKLVSGHKLVDSPGRILQGKGGQTVTDGPFPEAREVIGGLFVIESANYDEAVELSRDCPHLDYGTIELREIDRTVMPDTP